MVPSLTRLNKMNTPQLMALFMFTTVESIRTITNDTELAPIDLTQQGVDVMAIGDFKPIGLLIGALGQNDILVYEVKVL